MALSRSLHTTARWASCRAAPRVFAGTQTRSLSTALQRSRPSLACGSGSTPSILSHSRSYWWSKTPVSTVPDAAKDGLASPEATSSSSIAAPAESTNTPAVDSASMSSPIPADSPALPLESLSDTLNEAASAAANLPPPLQYGDLSALDLVHWTPAGFFPWVMEFTQVSTGLPWWSVIVLTTVGARIVLFPLVTRSVASAARLAPIQPQIAEMREEMNKARISRDTLALQRTALKQQALFKKAGVKPLDSVLTAVAQITVQFGFFIGLRRMCNLPVEQLKFGGLGVFTDLTVPDPYYILPIFNMLAINLQLTLSSKDMIASGNASMPHIINGFRLVSILGFYFIASLPAGLNIHLCTSILAICLQTLLLRNAAVRRALGVPLLPTTKMAKQPSFRDSFNYMKKSWKDKIAAQEAEYLEKQRKMMRMKK